MVSELYEEKCPGINPFFFFFWHRNGAQWGEMPNAGLLFQKEELFCEEICLSVTLLLRQRHLSVKRNAEWLAPSFRQGNNPLWGKMPETWTSSSNTEVSLYEEKSQEFGPPFLTERQSSVRRDAGSRVLLRQRNSTVCREMLIVKR